MAPFRTLARALRLARSQRWDPRRLRQSLRSLGGPAEAGPYRRGTLLFLLNGLCVSIGDAFVGPYQSLFLLSLGASGQQVGFLASVSGLAGALMFLPGARLTARFASYRSLVVTTSLAARAMMALIVILPWFIRGPAAIGAVIALVALRDALAQLGVPAWTAFSAAIVPQHLRGRFFSSRTFVMTLATLVVVPLAGWLIGAIAAPGGYQLSFGLGLAAGLVAILLYSRIPVPAEAMARQTHQLPLRKVLAGLRRHGAFLRFSLTSMLLNVSVQLVGPFFSVYVVRELGADAGFVGIMTTVQTAASLLGTRFYGPLVDRRGLRWAMTRTSPFIALLPALWLLPREPWMVLPINLMGGFAWAGYNLAAFNMLLASTPDDERPLYSALHNTGAALTAIVGPLIGGFLFDRWGFHTSLICSAAGRGAAALLIFLLIGRAGRGLGLRRQLPAPAARRL
ncbi:MAG: MFS transporter [Anaerolineae bacterium]|nr:MFS transporter [Anaerolineae bacterium]